MKTELVENWEVGKLIKLRDENFIRVNPEYQRAAVWKLWQMKLLIDSILRGYQIPLIYLRVVSDYDADLGWGSKYSELIDGQQRINALRFFKKGVIHNSSGDQERPFGKLFDPRKDVSLFPREFLDSQMAEAQTECRWAGTEFKDWTQDQQDDFLKIRVPVAVINDCKTAEARDLFIRLQSGSDLNAQERRDAWPGKICQLVTEIGGKKGTAPGHSFFHKAMKPKKTGDRGEMRQLVAQMLMIFLAQKDSGRNHFVSIKSAALDNFYRSEAGIELKDPKVRDFKNILDALADLFGDGHRPPLKKHDAIHLVLLTDELMNDYASVWRTNLVAAFDSFANLVDTARKYKSPPTDVGENFMRIWQYAQKIKSGQGAEDIKVRHEIYRKQMLELINAPEKDRQRAFTSAQKEVIYRRAQGQCEYVDGNGNRCGEKVPFADAHYHHKEEYQHGGTTTVENGALMHPDCHRKLHGG